VMGMPDRIALVTGGAGFIGSHLCDALLARGLHVRVLDDFSTGRKENVDPRCEVIRADVADHDALARAMEGVDVVFHLAAQVTIRGSTDRFEEDARTNLMGTLAVLATAGQRGGRRLVFASSMGVYADSPEGRAASEDHPQEPISAYGISKLAAERYVLQLAPKLGIEPVVLRFFNTYGTRQGYTPYVGVITIFVNRLLAGEPITIFGDGKQARDFVHVSDLVQANLLAMDTDAVGQVFNVGTGVATTVQEIADMLRRAIRPDAEIRYEPARGEELRYAVADVAKAQRILGYEPTCRLGDRIDEVIEYCKRSAQ
jgi:UDP-glucose 4-epimerase